MNGLTIEDASVPVDSRATDRVVLIGAEMRHGSDRAGSAGPLTEPYLGGVLEGAKTVLFAGPHDPALVSRAAGRHRVTLQTRRAGDASEASGDVRLRDVAILCGSADLIPDVFDVVIALGGLHQITTPDAFLGRDGERGGWADSVRALAARVAPGGTLVFAAGNACGLPRLNSLVPARLNAFASTGHDDAAPEDEDRDGPGQMSLDTPVERADEHAAGYDAISRELAAAGFTVGASLAVYPDVATAGLVIHRRLVDDPETRDLAELLAASAAIGPYRDGAVGAPMTASDPRRLTRDAVRHGLGHALAPGWILIATRAGSGAIQTAPIPCVAVLASAGATPGRVVVGASGAIGPVDEGDPASGWLPERTLPAGRLLGEHLADACGRHDLVAVRALMTAYATWLGVSSESGRCPDGRFAGTPGNVVFDGSDLRVLVPTADPAEPVPATTAFLRGLLEFAYELQSGGLPHPWPVTLTPARLAVRLASMAGVRTAEPDVEPDADAVPGPMGVLARPAGYAEAVRLATAISAELAEAREQLRFLAETIADRDRRLRKNSARRKLMKLIRHPLKTLRKRRKRAAKGN